MEGGSIGPGYSLDGGDSAMDPSLAGSDGSTYRNKKHGGAVSQIDMSSGASQQILGKGQGPSIDEETLEAALSFATQGKGGGDGSTIRSGSLANADDMSQMTMGGETVGTGGDGGGSTIAPGDGSTIGETDVSSTKKSKRQKQLDGILKSKGLSKPPSSGDSVTSVNTASSSGSSIIKFPARLNRYSSRHARPLLKLTLSYPLERRDRKAIMAFSRQAGRQKVFD